MNRLVSALIASARRTRRGQLALYWLGLRILQAADWVERHDTDPIPPGERRGASWVAGHDKGDVTMGPSYGGSDTTPQTAHQDPLPQASGPDVSPLRPDVVAAIEWVKRNPGIGLIHFKPENHRALQDDA